MTKTPAAPTDNNATGATASNATPPTTLCMPENCQDVTEQQRGKVLGIVGRASRLDIPSQGD